MDYLITAFSEGRELMGTDNGAIVRNAKIFNI